MISDLCASLAAAATAGDLAAARVAHEAIGRLLQADGEDRSGAQVIDIAERRDRDWK